MTRFLTIFVAVAGLAIAVWAVSTAKEKPPVLPPVREPSVNPFGRGVASLGFVEPLSRAIEIAPPESGLVDRVSVQVGARVKPGEELFALESVKIAAQLVEAQAAIATSRSELDRLRSLPRKEDLPPLQAAVERSKASLAEHRELLARITSARGQNGATDWDAVREKLSVDAAEAELRKAEAELARLEAGPSKEELAVAQSAVSLDQAKVTSLQMMMDRMSVKSPAAATVVRRSIEPGEFIISDSSRPAMVLADLDHLAIRAHVDEEDIGLVQQAAKSGTFSISARTRGSVVQSFKLALLRIEPFARPKTDLAGTASERVDTRVVDVVLTITEMPAIPLLPGQAVDVYFDTGTGN